NVRRLWAYYEEVTEEQSGEPIAPAGCAVVAIRGKSVEEIYLGLGDKQDGPLYWGEDSSNYGQMASTFSKRVWSVAFWHSQTSTDLSPFREVRTYLLRERKRLLRFVVSEAKSQGFKALEFSDAFCFCGHTDDAVIMAHQWEKAQCSLAVATK